MNQKDWMGFVKSKRRRLFVRSDNGTQKRAEGRTDFSVGWLVTSSKKGYAGKWSWRWDAGWVLAGQESPERTGEREVNELESI